MADKKWSEFDLLKSIKGKNIELLTIIEDNTSITGYDNKRVKLSDILDPINLDITNIKQQIQNIQVAGFDLTTIGVDPPYWYANEDDPENKQLVELSIAKDLKDRLDETNSRVQKNIEDITTINETILDLDSEVDKNRIDIDSLQFDVTKIENNYFNKNNIIQTVEDDETKKVPSSNAVFDFVKNAKIEANNYTNTQINEILKKITNLDFSGFYFDDTIKNGDYASGREPDDVVINRLSQKIFVVDDNYLYKELSLNKIEVLEIANKVVDWHNSNLKESYENGAYIISQKEAHPDFQGKYVGKTNLKGFNITNPIECELGVTPNDDCYLFAERGDIPETDCYIVINDNTQCKKINSSEYVNFIDFIKPEYKNLFYSSIIIKVFWQEYNNWWRIDFHYNSYPSGNINFKNINIQDLFVSSDNFYIKTQYFNDFYPSNSSEVFNDYKQHVPSEIDYFHSVHNLNNGFSQNFLDIPITFTRVLLDNTFVYKCESNALDLSMFDGYMINIDLSQVCNGRKLSDIFYNDYSGVPKSCEELDIHNVTSNLLLKFQESGDDEQMITTFCYFKNNIYPNLIQDTVNLIFKNPDNVAHYYIDEQIESITIMCNLVTPAGAVYYNGCLDTYSLIEYPCFLTGTNNLSSIGNQFIFGNNNIPTESCFIIGQKSGTFNSATGSQYRSSDNRGNIFEIDNSGLIFIKVQKDLEKTYDSGGKETLNLEYKCLQKILIDLNTKIVELENRVKELENP